MKGEQPSLTTARSQTRVHADSLEPSRPSKGHAPSRAPAAAARTARASSSGRARARARGRVSFPALTAPGPLTPPTPCRAGSASTTGPGCCEPATGSHFKAELEVTGERAGSGVQSRLSALAAAEWPGRLSRRLQPATPRPPEPALCCDLPTRTLPASQQRCDSAPVVASLRLPVQVKGSG